MSSYDISPLSFEKLNTYSVYGRHSKVSVEDFASPVTSGMSVEALIKCLPAQLMGVDFPEFIHKTAEAFKNQRPIILGMGAHVIKVGLNPILISLMKKGLLAGIALNGAGIIHDTEIAMVGRTSEEVANVLGAGAFGAAKETGEVLNHAIAQAQTEGIGIGEAVGAMLWRKEFPHNNHSLIAMAYKYNVPVTVHVAMGTDIIHIHPGADGAAIGEAGHYDFRLFSKLISNLQGGVYINVGSAVLLPEVFLKALTAVRNLGHEVKQFTTANFDFIRHYRPATNVVHRPNLEGGRGFNFTGHHELMLPLFVAALLDEIDK